MNIQKREVHCKRKEEAVKVLCVAAASRSNHNSRQSTIEAQDSSKERETACSRGKNR